MSKTLYVITKGPDQFSSDLLPQSLPPDDEVTVILLQDAVRLHTVAAPSVYALQEDLVARNLSPSRPTISYRDMLKMIFEADRVVTM